MEFPWLAKGLLLQPWAFNMTVEKRYYPDFLPIFTTLIDLLSTFSSQLFLQFKFLYRIDASYFHDRLHEHIT